MLNISPSQLNSFCESNGVCLRESPGSVCYCPLLVTLSLSHTHAYFHLIGELISKVQLLSWRWAEPVSTAISVQCFDWQWWEADWWL